MRGGLALGDRLKTVAITATVTSLAWLAFGSGAIDSIGNLAVLRKVNTAPSAVPPGQPASTAQNATLNATTANPLVTRQARSQPQAAPGEFLLPVAGVTPDRLIDTFNQARDGGSRVHEAIDIIAPLGTPIVAAVGGTVEKLFTSNAGGLTVYVRSPDKRTITYYAHLDAYAPGLAEKQQLRRGQPIGTVGISGNADPAVPHLHFAIMQTRPDAGWWEPASAINPYPVLMGRR